MGAGQSSQPYRAPIENHVADFDFSLFEPRGTHRVISKHGPNIRDMHVDVVDEIQLTLEQTINHGDEHNRSLHQQYWFAYRCCTVCTIITWASAALIAILGMQYWFLSEDFHRDSTFTYVALGAFAIFFFVQCYCWSTTDQRRKEARRNWRISTMELITEKTKQWHEQWPEFSMNIIYPIALQNNRGRVGDIRGTLRIWKGPPQISGPQWPVYRSFVAAQASQESAMSNAQQQGGATPVMIQGMNGQPMMVHGQKAIVNGQEVLLVQPPAGIQQVAFFQPRQQQNAAILNPMRSAMSTSNPNVPLMDYKPAHAYNPQLQYEDEEPPDAPLVVGSQNEGGGRGAFTNQ